MIRTPHRLIALLFAVVLSAGACSSGSDDSTADSPAASSESSDADSGDADSGDAESAAPAGRDENGFSLDPDCAAGEAANLAIRRDSGWLGGIVDETLVSSGGGAPRDLQPLIDAVAALRPFQDTETDFGTMREALDGLQSNIDAVQEARYGDIEEIPVVVVIGETVSIICS